MPQSRRSGFTLVELMVALVIFTLVAASLYKVLNVSQRTSRTQTEKAAMQGGLRTGLQLAMAEMQEIWTDQSAGTSAITAMTSTVLSYEAMRGLGITCGPVTGTSVPLSATTWTGLIAPAVGQGLYLFDEGADPDITTDDVWRNTNITAVTAGTCADGITPSTVLTVSNMGLVPNVKVPGPARTHEPMQLGLVSSGGRNWLGLAAGGALTPLAGPLTSTGLLLEYKNAAGANTGTLANVKSIILHMYAETDRAANADFSGTTTILQDSMIVRVQLRNGR